MLKQIIVTNYTKIQLKVKLDEVNELGEGEHKHESWTSDQFGL